MPVAIACDKCGKRYSVNESALGKRVTCKQCANGFVAKVAESKPVAPAKVATGSAAVASKPIIRAPAVSKPPTAKLTAPIRTEADDWSALEAAATGPEVVESPSPANAVNRSVPVGESAANAAAFLRRFSPGTIIRMSAVVLALLCVLAAWVTPWAQVLGALFFVGGSVIFFFVGLIVIIVRGLRAEGDEKISAGAVIGLMVSVILSVLARRAIVLMRGSRGGGIPLRKIVGLFGNALFILLMGIVVTPGANGLWQSPNDSDADLPDNAISQGTDVTNIACVTDFATADGKPSDSTAGTAVCSRTNCHAENHRSD